MPIKRHKRAAPWYAALGTLAALLAWLATHINVRMACALANGACAELTLGDLRGPIPGQVRPVQGRCPAGYEALEGACWGELETRPPCPVGAYTARQRCWLPLMDREREPRATGN